MCESQRTPLRRGAHRFPVELTASPCLSQQMPPVLSKVCESCGTQEASCWYGKRGGPHWCKKAACMRAGGYLPPLQGRRQKRARTGGEGSEGGGPNEEEMLAAEPIPLIWELLGVEGQLYCGGVAEV